ncbi:MAG: hypothetical protein IJX26_01315 [Clostridia bacterium]|nr:hypothetical protein [Clostridia bacterium]
MSKTNYGEEYNRESMYETVRELFIEGKKVVVNGSKCESLISVMIEDYKQEDKKRGEIYNYLKELMNNNKEDDIIAKKMREMLKISKKMEKISQGADSACKAYSDETFDRLNLRTKISKLCQKGRAKTITLEELYELRDLVKELEKIYIEEIYGDTINVNSMKNLRKLQEAKRLFRKEFARVKAERKYNQQ